MSKECKKQKYSSLSEYKEWEMQDPCRKKSISLLQSFEQRLFKITGCPAVTVQDQTGRSYFAHQTSVDTSIKVDKFTHDFICRAVSTSLRLICAEALGKYPDWQSRTCEMEAKEAASECCATQSLERQAELQEHCRSRSQ